MKKTAAQIRATARAEQIRAMHAALGKAGSAKPCTETARRLGVSRATVHRALGTAQEQRYFMPAKMLKVAAALEVTPDALAAAVLLHADGSLHISSAAYDRRMRDRMTAMASSPSA